MVIQLPDRCRICGGDRFESVEILWPALTQAWQLSPAEIALMNLQQGFKCLTCGNNLRMMALAHAILRAFRADGELLDFARSEAAAHIRALEINGSFVENRGLESMPLRTIAHYPDIDMMALPFADEAFDLVLHSDTLEHVPRPIAGLRECRRVLRHGGILAFTTPFIEGRLSRSREGLVPSYHGDPSVGSDDLIVHTEYGADVWCHVIAAGFSEVRLVPFAAPAAYGVIGIA